MVAAPRSRQLARGGLVLLDLAHRRILRAAVFQYNPERLRRTVVAAADGDGAEELVELELVLDASDWLCAGDPQAPEGIQPRLATLESIAFPPRSLAEVPLTVLVWGRARVLPVRVREVVTVEDAFDAALHPPGASEHLVTRAASEERNRLAEAGADSLEQLGVSESQLL